ncbi:uncharacterized protein LOC111061634 isoform X4 [Nilaparvata lugens]|uniref:uncharacterized protein LOC111061634 isoform X4 n=2 Tax=Nilaparvata lugens TaxID=108931 RepID=UPI00193EA72A|nr:uncharacterized protein LOC111061634 isoform X4 [Nilaparvata lugens]
MYSVSLLLLCSRYATSPMLYAVNFNNLRWQQLLSRRRPIAAKTQYQAAALHGLQTIIMLMKMIVMAANVQPTVNYSSKAKQIMFKMQKKVRRKMIAAYLATSTHKLYFQVMKQKV